jgi:hypothetical protein
MISVQPQKEDSERVNSFDRHDSFIIGYFLINGSGESIIPFVFSKMSGLNNICKYVRHERIVL